MARRESEKIADYYDVFQLHRNADTETIRRVYRILAERLDPDHSKTGDEDRFLTLLEAYEVLSDPARRAEYDAGLPNEEARKDPVFQDAEFLDGVERESNRRLGVLSLLYHRRRLNDGRGMSVIEMEQRMSLPREYLTFTLWYLRFKKYVMVDDNAEYGITPEGADHMESAALENPLAKDLLESRMATETTRLRVSKAAAA